MSQAANRSGSLADITGVIASHGINVQSIAVDSSEQPGRSRITVVVPRDDEGRASLTQQACDLQLRLAVSVALYDCSSRATSWTLGTQL